MELLLKFQEGFEFVFVEFSFGEDLTGLLLVVPEVGVGGLGFEFLDFLGEERDVKDTS